MTGQSQSYGPAAALAHLIEVSTSSAATGAHLVTVVGGAGSGRSTLLRRLADAHREIHVAGRVLSAQGLPWESDRAGGIGDQLLPDDGTDLENTLAAQPQDDEGRTPILLTIDDAHHGDAASIHEVLSILVHHRDAPVLVVRTAPPDARLPDLAGAQTIQLTGLDADELTALAAEYRIVLHPVTAARLAAHTAGSPRAVLAMLTQVPRTYWSVPDAGLFAPTFLVDDVRSLLGRCTAQGRALIEALAVLEGDSGGADSLTTAPAAGALTADSLTAATTLGDVTDPLAALDNAIASGLVTIPPGIEPSRSAPRLRSPMHGAAVTAVMGLEATGALHRRAAEIVTDPARRLHHLVAATPVAEPALADRLEALARKLGTDGEWHSAASLFRQASRLTTDELLRDERLTRAADALLAAGDCGSAAALMPAVESLRETPLREATLGYLAILRGRTAEADMRLDRAWAISNAERDPEIAGTIAQRRVLLSLARCQGSELVSWADTAIGIVDDGSSANTEASVIKGLGLAWSGRPAEARALYDELTDSVGHGAQAQRVMMGRGWMEFGFDDLDSARSDLEIAVSMAQLRGSSRITQWALAWLARAHFVTGEWDLALAAVGRGRILARTSGIALITPLFEWTATQIHALRGDWDSARAALAASAVTEGSCEIMQVPTLLARASYAEAAADYGGVREALTAVVPLARHATGLSEPGFWPWVDQLANALVLEGRPEDADALLAPHEERARRRGHRSAQARLGYARGRLLGTTGDLPAARRAFEQALTDLEGLPLRYDRARVNFAYGQTLRRAGKRRAADEVISRARDLYQSLGAQTYVARCDRELRAGGLHTTVGSRDGVNLTPQEQAVASLVVQGMSNREVAAELYISAKTVQYHLTRIYGKIGVRSRAELTAVWR
ncbi:LuxR C-terminal-related transcriptional regulator [Gordonia zhaorongruii]|uniref:LuxR C-terminal-related transcriptional regulator n=1 Tax=Gordonia zhaorongruii TaxID=2597659 RepID=UPI00104EE198|nr:LuxR C-terminal-related transcriptional regulator [Gordonia zhaorongruii]